MIPFIDLKAQRRALGARLDAAIQRVLDHGQFVMGPEVSRLETALSSYTGTRHVITCSSGTDALVLVLMAKGVGQGDAVFCPSFTFCATAEAVCRMGATPVFVDVSLDTFNMDVASLEEAIGHARSTGLKPAGVIAVDLFGLPADYSAIEAVANQYGIWVLADAAQSFGARTAEGRVGSLTSVSATSFFPSKPLGCYGDGGAIFTNDEALAREIVLRRVHGQSADRQDSLCIGLTGRLDTIQAAVLLEKLTVLDEEIGRRQQVAERYANELSDVCHVPRPVGNVQSAWAQYTVRLEPSARDRVAEHLKANGIPTAIYYRQPVHRQTAYAEFPVAPSGLPVTEQLSAEVLSLPMHPYMAEADLSSITHAVRAALKA